jgi:DNA replication protein DnaC
LIRDVFILPYEPCAKCGNGLLIDPETKDVYKCLCRKDYEESLRFVLKLKTANLLTEKSSKDYYNSLISYSFDLYKGPDKEKNISKLRKYIIQFDDRFSSINLFFTGIPGTQKTTLAKFLVTESLRRGKTGYYIMVNDYIKLAEESSRDEQKKDLLNYINSVDILVLDECDQEKLIMYHSNWKESNFFPQVKYRLEMIRKSTIFCSNKPVTDLGEKFKGAIQDLIERETLTGLMRFEDIYAVHCEKINILSIWD